MSLPNPPPVSSVNGNYRLSDFYAVPGSHKFMYRPTRELWPAESLDGTLPAFGTTMRKSKPVPMKPSAWLLQNRSVAQVTWCPGLPEIIEDKILSDGGWKDQPGAHVLNLYDPPQLVYGDPTKAGPWVNHLHLLYSDDAEEIADWMAHRVQRPSEKVNHALVLGGGQGIGKDFLLQALKLAVGPWNFQEVTPPELMGNYTPFVRAVVLRMSEAHDLGEGGRVNRFALYERVKVYAAAPPDALVCVDKYIRRYLVPNILGFVITTNHKSDGIYLESDDRRHLVCWSTRVKEEFTKQFWKGLWDWLLKEGGASHSAAWLASRDLSGFDPAGIPKQTSAFFQIVNASASPEDAELADAIDEMKLPDAARPGEFVRRDIITLVDILTTKTGAALDWLLERKTRRSIPYRLERCGYFAVRNPDAKDGLWKIDDKRRTLYARTDMTPQASLEAAKAYVLKNAKGRGSG